MENVVGQAMENGFGRENLVPATKVCCFPKKNIFPRCQVNIFIFEEGSELPNFHFFEEGSDIPNCFFEVMVRHTKIRFSAWVDPSVKKKIRMSGPLKFFLTWNV